MIIDPHVHLRGEEYQGQEFLRKGFRDAKVVGIQALLEMPNPDPQLTSEKICNDRIGYVDLIRDGIYHGINIGLTDDIEQVKSALELVESSSRITADKVFYVHSTGNMGILDEDVQREIWKVKGEMKYNGVSMGHFEDEDSFDSEHQFNYKNPISHSLYQNPESELIQVERQVRNAVDNNFAGTFYVCHVSNPATIDYILNERKNVDFPIVTEMTFHHMFLNFEDYEVHGNNVKMNPPLRSKDMQEKLLEHVLKGNVDIIGTDHAPHLLRRKSTPKPPSGIPALPFWSRGLQMLLDLGIDKKLLEDMTFHNANKIFDLNLIRDCEGFPAERLVYPPELWNIYGYNPFSRIDGTS